MESLNAARSALRTLGGMLESRLELFSLETAIEKKRVAFLLCASVLAGGAMILTIVFAGIASLLWAPVEHRVSVAITWSLICATFAITSLAAIWLAIKKQQQPFEHTRSEITKDIACLHAAVRSAE